MPTQIKNLIDAYFDSIEPLHLFRAQINTADFALIQSVFPGRGSVTNIITPYARRIAELIREHQLTFDDRNELEAAVCRGLSSIQLDRQANVRNDVSGTSTTRNQPTANPSDVGGGKTFKKNVTAKRTPVGGKKS